MFTIDPMSRKPVYEQIIDQVEKFILAGILKPGDALPSVRNLSVSLSVNPNTIQKTFSELFTRGIIQSVPGRGSFISENAFVVLQQKSRAKLTDFQKLAEELLQAGVPLEELLQTVKDCAKEGLSDDGTVMNEGGA